MDLISTKRISGEVLTLKTSLSRFDINLKTAVAKAMMEPPICLLVVGFKAEYVLRTIKLCMFTAIHMY